jgi:hypothetical protein
MELMQRNPTDHHSSPPQPRPQPEPQSELEPARTDNVHVPTPSSISSASTPSEGGNVKLNEPGRSYVSSAHWEAMLDDIAELKGHFEKESDMEGEECGSDPSSSPGFYSHAPTGPQLLYGGAPYNTKSEIIASLPPRHTVDRLVSLYFNWFDMSPGKWPQIAAKCPTLCSQTTSQPFCTRSSS